TMELIPAGMLLFNDDFESYEVGDLVAASSDYWETWTGADGGGDDDAAVSDDFANSPTKSMLIADGGNDDMIFPLGDKAEGLFYVGFYTYVESGADYEGYFNFQGESTPGEVFAFETYFLQDGTGTIDVNGGETFNYTQDSWELVELIIDLDNNHASFRINGNYITSWEYTENLGGIDIFAGADSGTPKFYVDDITYRNLSFDGGTVTFNVTDEAGNPYEGASIAIDGSTITTDGDGSANIVLDGGSYEYTISADGYVDVTDEVIVDNDDPIVNVSLVLQWSATFNLDVEEWTGFDPTTDFIWLTGATADGTDGIADFDAWPAANSVAALKLLDEDGDLVYTVTVPNIDPGDYEYRYQVTQGTPVVSNEYPEAADDALTFSISDQDITINDAVPVGLDETNSLTSFNIYPNPTKGVITIGTENQCEVTVTNAIGQVIVTRIVDNQGTLDLSDQTQGLYFVTAKTDAETKTMRLIIE
ncbi:MAG: T9SS type A sorting domain-containing protein, partial [Salinivirgaceae bacterium]